MDWLPQHWAIILALITMAAAWGRHSQRITAAEARQKVTDQKLAALEQRHNDLDRQLARDLEQIRVSLARIEEALKALQDRRAA